MRRFAFLVAICVVPLPAEAQTSTRGTEPAPVPSISPPTAQTGGGNVPPEQIAPAAPGTAGRMSPPPGAAMHDRDAPQSSVPANR